MDAQAHRGYLFLDACAFETEARHRNIFQDFDALRKGLELQFNCVFDQKHYFNSVENPHDRNDCHAKLQHLGWNLHLFGYKKVTRAVKRRRTTSIEGAQDPYVKFTAEDGTVAIPSPGTYEFKVQAGVDSALTTAMSLMHGQAPSDATFVLIASDGDFHSALSLLRDAGRDVHVVFWGPGHSSGTTSSAVLAAGLTKFLKPKPRQPGASEKYLYLDEILTVPFIRKAEHQEMRSSSSEWSCKCGFKNNVLNDVCGGKGSMGCKAPRPLSSVSESHSAASSQPPGYLSTSAPSQPQAITTAPNRPPGYLSTSPPSQPQALDASQWLCPGCGFRNNQCNDVCGGTGTAGCKLPKPLPASSQAKVDEWQCAACGWSNKASNAVCGGTGNMGCKAARGLEIKVTKPPELGDWRCENCSWLNKAVNQVCGGKGERGCKQPKPHYQ